MKTQLKRWICRLTVTCGFIAALLLAIILNPVLTYAHQTSYGGHTVFHNHPLPAAFRNRFSEATDCLKTSELYHPGVRLNICLNENGNVYTGIVRCLRGPAFAWGFYEDVVLQGQVDFDKNYVTLNDYRWNLAQLLSHEMTHCLQFDALGFWKSKPVAAIPEWKWEGYAEYVSRKDASQQDLRANIRRLIGTKPSTWAVVFEDGTIAPR